MTAASSTATSSTVTAMPSMSGSVISGRTSTSAVKARWSPSAISVTSMSGRPIGFTSSVAVTASEYLAGTAAFTTSSSTTPRPRRASRMRAGALPGRKPGIRTCWAILRYARSKSGLSSSKGTSTLMRTRVGLRRSTVLFTGSLLGTGAAWLAAADALRRRHDRGGRRCGTARHCRPVLGAAESGRPSAVSRLIRRCGFGGPAGAARSRRRSRPRDPVVEAARAAAEGPADVGRLRGRAGSPWPRTAAW